MSTITESTVRSLARRHGYRVAKRRRDGSYGLFDVSTRGLVLGDREGYGYSIEDVAERIQNSSSPRRMSRSSSVTRASRRA